MPDQAVGTSGLRRAGVLRSAARLRSKIYSRADGDASVILAAMKRSWLLTCALLPAEAHACVVTGPERQGWLRVDHGPEFTSALFGAWCESNGVHLEFIQPGKPSQNAYIERFNGSYRDGVLDAWVFTDLDHVREETERWLGEYNTIRPHESLGDVSPVEFLTDRGHADFSSYARI